MRWKDILNKDMIIFKPKINDKKDLFEKMANHFYNHDLVMSNKVMLNAMWDRENQVNTQIMDDFAIPHAKNDTVQQFFVCLVVLEEPLYYEHEDYSSVSFIFCVGTNNEHQKIYLQYLAKISRLLKDDLFRKRLLNAKSPEEIIDILSEFDQLELPNSSYDPYLLMITLTDKTVIPTVISALLELGINNAAIIETTSLANKTTSDIPVFANLNFLDQEQRSEVIMANITNRSYAKKIFDLLLSNDIDLRKPNIGFIQLIKVETVLGNPEEEIDI